MRQPAIKTQEKVAQFLAQKGATKVEAEEATSNRFFSKKYGRHDDAGLDAQENGAAYFRTNSAGYEVAFNADGEPL